MTCSWSSYIQEFSIIGKLRIEIYIAGYDTLTHLSNGKSIFCFAQLVKTTTIIEIYIAGVMDIGY